MAQERPSRLVELYLLLRSQIPVLRDRLTDWLAAVQEQPVLIWQTAAVRYATYGLGALLLLWTVTGFRSMLASPPADARPAATTGDFHVVCSDARCEYHFVIHREFGFRKFPVECQKCGQKTGMQARKCNSETCRGRWVALKKMDDGLHCSVCGRRFE